MNPKLTNDYNLNFALIAKRKFTSATSNRKVKCL